MCEQGLPAKTTGWATRSRRFVQRLDLLIFMAIFMHLCWKTNKIQEGDRLNIQKMVDLINVQYIGSVRYYWVDPEVPLGFSLIS